jgi:uncharacterized protein
MALRFEQSFVVKAPADRVWAYLTDPYRVVTALPGAAVTEKVDDRTYQGTITMKVGPVSARYRGTARFEKLDAAARAVEVAASGQDLSGRGGADMRMTSQLVERGPGETAVSVVSEVNVTGILAQFGRGMIQDVSDQMFERFTTAVREALEHPAVDPGAASVPDPSAGSVPVPVPGSGTGTGTGTGSETAAPAVAPPIEVVSFGTRLAGRALSRAARRPGFWVAVGLSLLVLFWLMSR